VVAAKRGSSISRLLAEQIDLLARQDDDYDRAMHDALAELERGYDLGGGPYPARDEVHFDEDVRRHHHRPLCA
jgi:hypothetical protein